MARLRHEDRLGKGDSEAARRTNAECGQIHHLTRGHGKLGEGSDFFTFSRWTRLEIQSFIFVWKKIKIVFFLNFKFAVGREKYQWHIFTLLVRGFGKGKDKTGVSRSILISSGPHHRSERPESEK